MAKARVAPAAQAILSQATFYRPKRSKRSDGTIGDRRHRRSVSDHNPDGRGVVHAADLTHDPARGMDAHGWADWLARRGDRRVKYIISNRRIWEPGSGWRRYTGINPHTAHVHVSVRREFENDTSEWFAGYLYGIPATVAPAPSVTPKPADSVFVGDEAARLAFLFASIFDTRRDSLPTLREGYVGDWVRLWQGAFRWASGEPVPVDGQFGPATADTVRRMQQLAGQNPTGVIDIGAWGALRYAAHAKAST